MRKLEDCNDFRTQKFIERYGEDYLRQAVGRFGQPHAELRTEVRSATA